jgi:hypothetical protein
MTHWRHSGRIGSYFFVRVVFPPSAYVGRTADREDEESLESSAGMRVEGGAGNTAAKSKVEERGRGDDGELGEQL